MRPVQRTSVSDEIIAQIMDLIERNVLKPGDRLPPERELCKRFQVGRSSLREALRSLSMMGLLDGRVGEGTFVCDKGQYVERALQWGFLLDGKKLQDLSETRMMLESQNAYLAAERATAEDLAAIADTLAGMAWGAGRREALSRQRFTVPPTHCPGHAQFHPLQLARNDSQLLTRMDQGKLGGPVAGWPSGRTVAGGTPPDLGGIAAAGCGGCAAGDGGAHLLQQRGFAAD